MAFTETIERNIWSTRVALGEYDVRGALVLGGERALVWDTLARPRDMRTYLPFIGSRELVIVYSHADWDHIWGTAGLPHTGVRIVAHESCSERFKTDVPKTLATKQGDEPGLWDDVVLVPPTETFSGEHSIDLGGLTVTLSHLPGHTSDCLVAFVPERGLLLAGDTVETPCPVVPADAPLDAWIAALRRWEADERVCSVVPAHGPIGGREILSRNIAYLEALRSGHPIEPAGALTPFYRKTHATNVAGRASGS
ncbi:MAG TPA: MBL fold metallo-hydrolase [Gemmatimonadales bacterium]|nr:MBL fold metallo-hydrolase [Gemmatimonadales bacterium]